MTPSEKHAHERCQPLSSAYSDSKRTPQAKTTAKQRRAIRRFKTNNR